VRARGLQDAFALLESRDPDAYAQLRERLPPETWKLVHNSAKTDWIGGEHERLIVGCWVPILGDGAVGFLSDAVLDTIESPLFNALAHGAVRLFGATPRSLIKFLPRGWSNTYRDHLSVRIDKITDEGALLHFEDIAVGDLSTVPARGRGAVGALAE
jgi:hypothetical protein